MKQHYDIVVVGSGFGGSVMAYRLAQKQYDVLVLERGRRWQPDDYPRELSDPWIFDPDEPEKQHGWLDLRIFDDMMVAQGAGVGGGSLIYANISVDAPEFIFERGWPEEINFAELARYYARVEAVLEPATVPLGQATRRFRLMQEAAEAIGEADRFQALPLAVRFDEAWSYDRDDPFNRNNSNPSPNQFGRMQGTCVHCGNCDIGCRVQAKNTLDLNYLAGAEDAGVDIEPLHVVEKITPGGPGQYYVHYQRIDSETESKVEGHVSASNVVLAAGSLGSTELLLRCRDQYRTLPELSSYLGRNWSSNGDFLTPATYENRDINPTQGPTISAAIDFLDGSQDGARFFVEDGGFPNVLHNYFEEKLRRKLPPWKFRKAARELRRKRKNDPLLSSVMPWFAQGIDAADGRLYLARKWFSRKRRKLALDWDITDSEAVIEGIIAMHERLTEATGPANTWQAPTWRFARDLVTPHPLGGCNMGRDRYHGVVDHVGRVFDYPGLYVVDGAIVPEAIGRNPSKTIAALAERCADHFPEKGSQS